MALNERDIQDIKRRVAYAFGAPATSADNKSIEQVMDELASAAGVLATGKIRHGHTIDVEDRELVNAAIDLITAQRDNLSTLNARVSDYLSAYNEKDKRGTARETYKKLQGADMEKFDEAKKTLAGLLKYHHKELDKDGKASIVVSGGAYLNLRDYLNDELKLSGVTARSHNSDGLLWADVTIGRNEQEREAYYEKMKTELAGYDTKKKVTSPEKAEKHKKLLAAFKDALDAGENSVKIEAHVSSFHALNDYLREIDLKTGPSGVLDVSHGGSKYERGACTNGYITIELRRDLGAKEKFYEKMREIGVDSPNGQNNSDVEDHSALKRKQGLE